MMAPVTGCDKQLTRLYLTMVCEEINTKPRKSTVIGSQVLKARYRYTWRYNASAWEKENGRYWFIGKTEANNNKNINFISTQHLQF